LTRKFNHSICNLLVRHAIGVFRGIFLLAGCAGILLTPVVKVEIHSIVLRLIIRDENRSAVAYPQVIQRLEDKLFFPLILWAVMV